MKAKRYRDALSCFESAITPPENLRAEQRFDQRLSVINYWKGCAFEALRDNEKAREAWNEVINPNTRVFREGVAGGGIAAGGGMGPGGTLSQGNRFMMAEQLYYRALAEEKLGINKDTKETFNEIIQNGEDTSAMQSGRQQYRPIAAIAHYNLGLGYAGLGNRQRAKEEFKAALAESPDYLAAKIAIDLL